MTSLVLFLNNGGPLMSGFSFVATTVHGGSMLLIHIYHQNENS